MTHYIDKDALVAELEKRIRDYWSDSENTMGIYPYALEEVIKYIDTLKVKEVELTWKDVREICTQSVLVEIDLGCLVSDERHYTEVLKRFKAQKGE